MNAWGNLSYALLFEYSLLEAFCVKINTAVFMSCTQLFKKAKARGYGDHDTSAIFRATDWSVLLM